MKERTVANRRAWLVLAGAGVLAVGRLALAGWGALPVSRLALATAGALVASRPPVTRAAGVADIAQPRTPTREAFMQRAVELRRLAVERGDQPYGAVVVKDGRIVGEGVSAVLTTPDPTAHAEMQAIRDAARRLRTADLAGCELYGTSRACPMCEAGAAWARIARLWYGEPPTDGGPPRLR